MRVGSRESFTSQIIRQTSCLHVTKPSLSFAQVHIVENSILKSTVYRLFFIITLQCGNKILTNSNTILLTPSWPWRHINVTGYMQ